MTNSEEDSWLGTVYRFPPQLHARASFSFDINPGSLQTALVSALARLSKTSTPKEITVADREGYSKGRLEFRIGIGNGEGFDIFDAKEEERLLDRIENRGPFETLDLTFHIRYLIDDGRRHKAHQDRYIVRLAFQPGRVEMLLHHLKGVMRVDPTELVSLLLEQLNAELSRGQFTKLKLEVVSSS